MRLYFQGTDSSEAATMRPSSPCLIRTARSKWLHRIRTQLEPVSLRRLAPGQVLLAFCPSSEVILDFPSPDEARAFSERLAGRHNLVEVEKFQPAPVHRRNAFRRKLGAAVFLAASVVLVVAILVRPGAPTDPRVPGTLGLEVPPIGVRTGFSDVAPIDQLPKVSEAVPDRLPPDEPAEPYVPRPSSRRKDHFPDRVAVPVADPVAAPAAPVASVAYVRSRSLPGTFSGFWSVGSSEARVRTIQGPPTRVREIPDAVVLVYGRDLVALDPETRKVVEWRNATGALRVRALRDGKPVARRAGTSSREG